MSSSTTASATPTPNTAPRAKASAKPASALTGDPVRLSSSGSSDRETVASRLRYSWSFGNGGSTVDSTQANPTVRYTTKGVFTAVLTVTDPQGLRSKASVRVRVFKRVDCQSSSVVRQGPWRVVSGGGRGGKYCDNQGKGAHASPDTLSLGFTATSLRIDFGAKTGGGTAVVFIDGKRKAALSFTGSTSQVKFNKTRLIKNLTNKRHQVRVEVSGKAYVDTFVY